ncbi:MAG: hypothetical protein U0794_20630 [Isosphaeraceae bacterium]
MDGSPGKLPAERTTARRRRVGLGWLVALSLVVFPSGCVGPPAIKHTRLKYNEVYRQTNDEQLLLNIVRLRYADSPVFVDLPTITSQFEVTGHGGYTGGLDGQGPGRTNLGIGELTYRDTPTLSYHPREGRELSRALLTPLSAELFRIINAGSSIEQFLLMAVSDINDVPNAPRASYITPRVPDDNTLFRRGIRNLTRLGESNAVELAFSTSEEENGSSDPIPRARVEARDVLAAAKDGYVFRTSGDDAMSLRKREKSLVVKIRPEAVNSPELHETAQIFHLAPGRDLYKIKSELSEDASEDLPSALGGDTLYLNMRSVLQIAVFLGKGVCVPPEHVARGVVPVTTLPDGRPFDWTQVTDGLFRVQSQKKRPNDAEVAVFYRDYWFYIPKCDVTSRASLAIFELLFSLQESEDKGSGPLLTLPIGG